MAEEQYHYFIGKLLFNYKDKQVNQSFKTLSQTQQYLLNAAGKDNKKVFPFINFGYLGKYNYATEKVLKEKIDGLIHGLGDSIPKMNGYYQKYSLIDDNSKKYIAIDYTLFKDDMFSKIIKDTITSFVDIYQPNTKSAIKLVEVNPGNEDIITKKNERNNDLLTKTRRPSPNYFVFDSIELIRSKATDNGELDLSKLRLELVDKVSLKGELLDDKIPAKINKNNKTNEKMNNKTNNKTNNKDTIIIKDELLVL